MSAPELTPMTERRQHAVRAMLVTEAARTDSAAHTHRGWAAAVIGTVAVTAVTAVAVVLTQAAGNESAPPAAPSVPAPTITSPVPQPGPGQFLYSRTTDTGIDGTQCGNDPNGVQFVIPYTRQQWAEPGVDGARHLVITYGTPEYLTAADATIGEASCPDVLTKEGTAYAADNNIDVRGNSPSLGTPPHAGSPSPFQQPTAAFLDGLPRDPATLLQQLSAINSLPEGNTPTLRNTTDFLHAGVALPLDLRGAAVKGLTLLPGADVVVNGARVTITVAEGNGSPPNSATFDITTGLVTSQTFNGPNFTVATQYGVTTNDTTIPSTLN